MRNAIYNADKQFSISGSHVKFLLAIEQLDQEHWDGRNIVSLPFHPINVWHQLWGWQSWCEPF
jgi:hypothetical protein